MATEQLPVLFPTGRTLWAGVFNEGGEVFDFDSDTFVAPTLPPVDPSYEMEEMDHTGGNGQNVYLFVDPLDLSRINGTSTPLSVVINVYDQVGGSPDLDADTVIASGNATIKEGEVAAPGFTTISCQFLPVYRMNDDTLILTLWLEIGGNKVTLAGDATCSVAVRQLNPVQGTNLFAVSASAPDANNVFTLEKEAPWEDTDLYAKGLRAVITIVNDGVTYTFTKLFPGYA